MFNCNIYLKLSNFVDGHYTNIQKSKNKSIKTKKQTNIQACKHTTYKHTNKQAFKNTTYKHANIQTYNLYNNNMYLVASSLHPTLLFRQKTF